MAFELAAVIDPFGPLIEMVETTNTNFMQLAKYWVENPFPILSTMLANQGTYFEELMNGQGDLILGQIWNNVQTLFSAPFSPGTTLDVQGTAVAIGENISDTAVNVGDDSFPLYFDKESIYLAVLQEFLRNGQVEELKALAPVLNFTNTHISSFLLGVAGPLIAPFVQLGASFEAIGAALEAADFVTAFNEFINIPVRMTNAFLNGGQFLDLTGIVNAINPLPPGISKIGVELGGLLNLVPQDGTFAPVGPAPTVYGGGVGFDGLVIDANLGPVSGTVPGLPIGLAGASLGLNRYTAQQMLVTPPLKSQAASAPAVEVVADTPAPVEDTPAPVEAPAPVEVPAPAEAPAEEPAVAVEEVAAVVDDPAPAVEDVAEIEAAVEAIEAPEAEPAEAPAPVAEDSGPEAAAGADEQSDGDTGRAARSTQRGDN
jgi:hypothetical protein